MSVRLVVTQLGLVARHPRIFESLSPALRPGRSVATCTHGRTCVPEKCGRKVTVDVFVAHAHSKK